MIRHMLEVQSRVPYLSQTEVDCRVNMAYDTTDDSVRSHFNVVLTSAYHVITMLQN